MVLSAVVSEFLLCFLSLMNQPHFKVNSSPYLFFFFFFQGMHLCFLGLYAFVILFSFHKSWPSIYEIVLLCWIGVIIMDEIRQVSNKELKQMNFELVYRI